MRDLRRPVTRNIVYGGAPPEKPFTEYLDDEEEREPGPVEEASWSEFVHPRGRTGLWRRKMTTTLGVTPFRAAKDKPEGFAESERAHQFEQAVKDEARKHQVKVKRMQPVTGVWEGSREPSWSVTLEDGPDATTLVASHLREQFEQDGVLVFRHDQNGKDVAFTLRGVTDIEKALEAMEAAGVPGGTFRSGSLEIIGSADDGVKARQIADALGAKLSASRGTMSMIEKP